MKCTCMLKMANHVALLLLLNINFAGVISSHVNAPMHVPITLMVMLPDNVNIWCYIPLPSSTIHLTLVTNCPSCIRTTLDCPHSYLTDL